jgi:hypothetical protein
MATQTQWPDMAYLHGCADLIAYGHAMPLSRVKLCIGIGKLNGPIFSVAQGLIVPISRGSPPIT